MFCSLGHGDRRPGERETADVAWLSSVANYQTANYHAYKRREENKFRHSSCSLHDKAKNVHTLFDSINKVPIYSMRGEILQQSAGRSVTWASGVSTPGTIPTPDGLIAYDGCC